MTEYTPGLAERIPDGHPYKARALYQNELARLRAEEAVVDDVVADFAPDLDGEEPAPVDLSEDENPQEPDDDAGGSFFGANELLKIAKEPSADLPQEVREDAELHEALWQQAVKEHFGEDDPSVTDDEMWAEYTRALGIEEG